MIAIANGKPKPADSCHAHWHNRFLDLLPAIRRCAVQAYGHLPRQVRDDRVNDVIANTLVAFRRLVDQGREDLAYPTVLARFAIAQVNAGRSVGTSANSKDVLSRGARLRHGIAVDRLDVQDDRTGSWREAVVEDHRSCPAEIAAFRIDFPAWLQSLSRQERRIALKLAAGETTNTVAELCRVSAARISQVRRELHEAWLRFHGEDDCCASALPAAA